MPVTQKTAINVVMGAMTFGEAGTEGARIHDLKDVEQILDVFQAHGHNEIDTARIYCGGTSEEYLSKANWQKRGLKMETKLYPSKGVVPGIEFITHSPEDLKKHLMKSLSALNTKKVDVWYLHGPDRSIPYEVTLKAVNDLHKDGYFERFGISNYMSWEVAEIVGICKANGYIQPTIYQGIYNAIHRNVENELFPCLRKFGISFYGFSPLAGGFFTTKYNPEIGGVEDGSRFDPNRVQGKSYRRRRATCQLKADVRDTRSYLLIGLIRYWNEHYFKALDVIRGAADKAGLTMPEVALRWISHHSSMRREHGDSVLIGASGLTQIEQNLVDLEKGPLPTEVVKALDEAWLLVTPYAVPYFH